MPISRNNPEAFLIAYFKPASNPKHQLPVDELQELIFQLPDINVPFGPFDYTALDYLLRSKLQNYENLILVLIRAGASVSDTTLHHLAKSPPIYSEATYKSVIEAYPDQLNEVTGDFFQESETILHIVAKKNPNPHPCMIQLCVTHECDINAVNERGSTALHVALRAKHYYTAGLLIQHGANLDIPDREGVTPRRMIQIARAPFLGSCVRDMSLCPTPSQAKFGDAIRAFIGKHKLTSISDAFDKKNPFHAHLFRDLFLDRVIVSYLARPWESVTLEETGSYPCYSQVERDFYDAAATNNVEIPTRSYEGSSDKQPHQIFYDTGTTPQTNNFQFEMFEKQHSQYDRYITFMHPHDLYGLSDRLVLFAEGVSIPTNSRGFAYIIGATRRDTHIFCTLSIINVEEGRIHSNYFFNSWQDKDYTNAFKNRIFSAEEAAPVKQGEPPYFCDASLHIQTNEDDGNCGLYTFEILTGLFQILDGNDELQQQLEKPEQPSQTTIDLIREKLMLSLNNLFNGKCQPKPYSDLKRHFMQVRWEIGRQYILSLFEKAHAALQAFDKAMRTIPAMGNAAVELKGFASLPIPSKPVVSPSKQIDKAADSKPTPTLQAGAQDNEDN